MSEEEKEIIEKIKNFMNNEKILQYQIKGKDIDTILNYISKLQNKANKLLIDYKQTVAELVVTQKENEELKDYKERTEHTIMLAKYTREKSKEKSKKLKELNELLADFIDNSISKDKIKDKIKELKKDMVKNGAIIDILYEILEGE